MNTKQSAQKKKNPRRLVYGIETAVLYFRCCHHLRSYFLSPKHWTNLVVRIFLPTQAHTHTQTHQRKKKAKNKTTSQNFNHFSLSLYSARNGTLRECRIFFFRERALVLIFGRFFFCLFFVWFYFFSNLWQKCEFI